MARKITDFLIATSEDPQRLNAYKRDADKELDKTTLTPQERALIKGGGKPLRDAVKQEAGPGAVVVVWET
jgi:hypothetical protein